MKSIISFYDRKMVLPVRTGIITRYYGELICVTYDKPYCVLHFAHNTKYMVDVSLQYLMDNLPSSVFIFGNRSSIINICYCRELNRSELFAIMENDIQIRMSKKNVLKFIWLMNNMPCISPPCPICYTCTNHECKNHAIFCHAFGKI